MKYVVLQNHYGEKAVVCGFHPVSHAELAGGAKARGEPTSAGFAILQGTRVVVYGRASDLRLTPAEGYAYLIAELSKSTLHLGIHSHEETQS